MENQEIIKKKIAILGSTGSIGTQALEVIEEHADKFQVEVLTAYKNADLLIEQAIKFKPNAVVIVDESRFEEVSEKLWEYDIKTFTGEEALAQVVEMEAVNIVLTALVGYAGLLPTIKAIKAKKTIALANKETLVVAGELITKLAAENGVAILPVDSEHGAIFQCLTGEIQNKIEKYYVEEGTVEFFNNKLLILTSSTIKLEKLTKENIVKMIDDSKVLLQNAEIKDKEKYIINHKIDALQQIN